MRVLFIEDPHPRETPVGEHYEAGKVYDLVDHAAHRWIGYGRAVEAPPEPVDPLAALAEANPAPDVASETSLEAPSPPADKPPRRSR